jgi:sulfopyruvate decarboxylase subunit alpha
MTASELSAAHPQAVVHPQAQTTDVMPRYATAFVDALRQADVRLVGVLPESLLKSVYVALDQAEDIRLVRVSNEADLPGLVAGAYCGGMRALMISENSGLRQACEPIARLAFAHQMPLVIVLSFRGEFGEPNWWGHNHSQVMEPLLKTLRIPYRVVSRIDDLASSVERAFLHADASQWPVCLVMTGECIEGGAE